MTGYNQHFFPHFPLPIPALTAAQQKLRAPLLTNPKQFDLDYMHFTAVLHKGRKFAFYTATNIDGLQWKAAVTDRDDFTKDSRVAAAHQTGNELYDFFKGKGSNDFDKGHITKFQDPQWGPDAATIKKAADDTMKFTNCLPQHHTLNRGAWKCLEDYVLKKFTPQKGANGRKVTVFAGPLLLATDPFYIDKIEGKALQIPCCFWKVVVYANKQNKLSAVAFLMSQKAILLKYNFVVAKKAQVRALKLSAPKPAPDFFTDFTSGEPYQISLKFLEQVTGFQFGLSAALQPYTKQEPTELIYKRVEVPLKHQKLSPTSMADSPLAFRFEGINL